LSVYKEIVQIKLNSLHIYTVKKILTIPIKIKIHVHQTI